MPDHDPIIAEVRKVRREYFARCGGSLRQMFDDLRRREKQSGQKTVTLPAKPARGSRQRRLGA